LRRILAILALSLLSACNVVVSKTPLLTAADEVGAPQLRPGVWVMEGDADCAIDARKPITEWPDCGGGMVFQDGQATSYTKKEGKGTWERQPLVLAAGDPRIAQVRFHMDITSGSGSQRNAADQMLYGYAAVRPTAFGPGGKITAVTYWLVQCGPPPPPAPPNAKPERAFQFGTRHPLPGIEMKKGDALCTTSSVDALRGAAKASEAWREKPMNAHWARPAGPGDQPPG
jgi:hypothetical protein